MPGNASYKQYRAAIASMGTRTVIPMAAPGRPGRIILGNGSAESLRDIASILKAQVPGATPTSGGDLGGRIAARRAQIVGARGPVGYDRVRAAVTRVSPGGRAVPLSAADLPSRQQLLVAQVTSAADAAQAILDSLVPTRAGQVDQAEVAAVVASLSSVVGALRSEALVRDPRSELVRVRQARLRYLQGRLRAVMGAGAGDRFQSREDLEQLNRLMLFAQHMAVIRLAWQGYFARPTKRVPVMDRVGDVQDQLRVVADSAAELRQRLHDAGASDAELAAPEGRLSRIDPRLSRMTMASLLTWMAELGGGREAADLPTTGSLGLYSIRDQATNVAGIVKAIIKATGGGSGVGGFVSFGSFVLGGGSQGGGALAEALRDQRVRDTLDALQLQLETVASTAGGTP